MYVLIGVREENEYSYHSYTGRTHCIEERLAAFDTEQMAKDYVNSSKLKNPKNKNRPFKKNSLLVNCKWAEIEQYIPESLVHNPSI